MIQHPRPRPNRYGGVGVPYFPWQFGATDCRLWEHARKMAFLDQLPNNHSSLFNATLGEGSDSGLGELGGGSLDILGIGYKCMYIYFYIPL